jgi:hypothetical protein
MALEGFLKILDFRVAILGDSIMPKTATTQRLL